MKKERLALFFIATIIGLLAAGTVLYFYQSARAIPDSQVNKISVRTPTPAPTPSIFLSVTSPKDDLVTDKRNLTISGKTVPNAKLVIVGPTDETSAIAGRDGSFTTTLALDDSENLIVITAVASNGETQTVKKAVTFTTEDF